MPYTESPCIARTLYEQVTKPITICCLLHGGFLLGSLSTLEMEAIGVSETFSDF
jgi:hypothetical protein